MNADFIRRELLTVMDCLSHLERGMPLLMNAVTDPEQIREIQTAKAYLRTALRELEGQ